MSPARAPGRVDRALAPVDRWQRRHTVPAFAVGVLRKGGDDRSGRLAGLIAYYGFLSLFPATLAFVSIVAFVLGGTDAEDTITGTLSQIPVVGADLASGGLRGSGTALAIGVLLALWAGLGAMNAAQDAFNDVYWIPRAERPGYAPRRVRSLVALVVLGLGLVAGGAASNLAAFAPWLSQWTRPLAFVLAAALYTGLFVLAFQILVARSVPWQRLLPGAAFGAVGYTTLVALGGVYVNLAVTRAQATYGTFAIVIGLLAWLHLLARVAVLAAEVNVVAAERLWPRGLTHHDPTPADARAARFAAGATRQYAQDVLAEALEDRPT